VRGSARGYDRVTQRTSNHLLTAECPAGEKESFFRGG
jgi:hypothetical protein